MRGRLIASMSLGLIFFLAIGLAGPALATGGDGSDPDDPGYDGPGPDYQPPDCPGDEGDPDDYWEIDVSTLPDVQLDELTVLVDWAKFVIVFLGR